MTNRFLSILLSGALVAPLLTAPSFAAEREETRTFPLSADGRLSLESINGDVRITSKDTDTVTVHWVIDARSSEALDHVRVDIDAHPDRIRISTDQDDWRGWRRSGWSVDFELTVPAGARLDDIELVNGSLTMKGQHRGPLGAELVNGAFRAEELGEDVSISTVNGSIDARIGTLSPRGRIDLESVNGSIELALPRDAVFDVRAETVHGRIRNDFGLYVDEDEWVGRSMDDSTGEGGARIRLETVNGAIDLDAR